MIGSHIIPRFYLEQFATRSSRGKDKPGRLWVYERGKSPHQRATSVQGFENGYFAFLRPDGSYEESLEVALAQKENECNEVLYCSRSELFHWSLVAQKRIAFYAALLYSRATQRHELNQSIHQNVIADLESATDDESLLEEITESLNGRHGTHVTVQIIRRQIKKWLQEAGHPAIAKNAFVSQLLENTDLIADILQRKQPWNVIRPPNGHEFITTDNPLITFVPLPNGKLNTGHGFNKQDAAAVFPLAPDACLLMGAAWQVPRTLDASTFHELCEAMVVICDRYAYSKTRSDQINVLVSGFGGTSRYGVSAFLPIGLKLPTARAILRQMFGLHPD